MSVEFPNYIAAVDKALLVEAEIKELRKIGDKVKWNKTRNSFEQSNKRPNQGQGLSRPNLAYFPTKSQYPSKPAC